MRKTDEITTVEKQLPDTIEDVARFVLIGTEKLKSLKAEIGAIKKLKLAQEVYDQKLEEQRRLSELILDAGVKIGEFSKQIPRQSGLRSDITLYSQDDKVVKTKEQAMRELGFNRNQTYEFETLANNRDLVEKVKQEAKDNNELPTRGKIIDLAQRRAQTPKGQTADEFCAHIDECWKLAKKYHKAIEAFMWIQADEKELGMLGEIIHANTAPGHLREVEDSITKLSKLRNFLKGVIEHDPVKKAGT